MARHKLVVLLGVVVLAVAAAVIAALSGDEASEPALAPAPAPQVVVQQVEAPEAPAELGFPEFATKNTTRVAGADAVADAAGVALAVHPSTGAVPGPPAVTLVDSADWAAGIAAASLVADPVGAPVLLTEDGELPELTANAIRALAPAGSPGTDGRQLFVIGSAVGPAGFDEQEVGGGSGGAPEIAAAIERLRTELAGDPEHLLVTTADDPAIAMPAAGWAARSGDPVLFVEDDRVPRATREALIRHRRTPVYVLGSQAAIPAKVLTEIDEVTATVERIAADDPVSSAIEFARYSSGSFGWNINDPGHGLVIANASRPLDAAAAAALSASGTWGPLLITEEADRVPDPLRNYLLDLKPGYESDPTRALYNHAWLIGDRSAISVGFQAEVDQLAEVAPVRSGSGAPALGPPPGSAESQPDSRQNGNDRKDTAR